MPISPIALFVYNRPDHALRTIRALAKNRLADKSELYVFSDGPKDENAARGVAEVRRLVSRISGFARVEIVEREENLGLAGSIIKGASALTASHGRVIVVEDDLETSPYFLEFMNKALDRYQDEERVMQVSGYMFPIRADARQAPWLLPVISTWGWAAWERSWRHMDVSASGFDELKKDAGLRKKFDVNGSKNFFRMLQDRLEGRNDSWGILWYLSVFMLNGLTLFPARSLVRNIGFDGSGAHCGPADAHEIILSGNVPGVERKEIELDREGVELLDRYFRSQRTFRTRVRSFLASGLKRLARI